MAFTLSNRLGLPIWTAGTDVFSRDELNNAFAALEDKVPILNIGIGSGKQPTDATPAKQFYLATDTGVVYLMDGSQWRSVGRVVEGTFVVRGESSDNLLELRAANGDVVLTIDSGGNMRRPGTGDFRAVSLPAGMTPLGGGSAAPGYYVNPDGFLVMQGEIYTNGAASLNLSVPRPLDLANHYWFVPTGARNFAEAFLTGANGNLLLQGVIGNIVWLDAINYMSEVL